MERAPTGAAAAGSAPASVQRSRGLDLETASSFFLISAVVVQGHSGLGEHSWRDASVRCNEIGPQEGVCCSDAPTLCCTTLCMAPYASCVWLLVHRTLCILYASYAWLLVHRTLCIPYASYAQLLMHRLRPRCVTCALRVLQSVGDDEATTDASRFYFRIMKVSTARSAGTDDDDGLLHVSR